MERRGCRGRPPWPFYERVVQRNAPRGPRGDHAGGGLHVQDGATLHVDTGLPLSIGERVTIGHNAVLHGCTVGDDCLVGMGAVVLSGAVIGRESLIGAGALVTEGKVFPPRCVILGSPAKAVRSVDDPMVERIRKNGRDYEELAVQALRDYAGTG